MYGFLFFGLSPFYVRERAVSDYARTKGKKFSIFKIEDIQKALSYIKVMFHLEKHEYNAFSLRYFLDRRMIFFILIAVIACVPWAQVMPRYIGTRVAQLSESNKTAPRMARHVCLIALLVISFIFIVNTTYSPFIYFQF